MADFGDILADPQKPAPEKDKKGKAEPKPKQTVITNNAVQGTVLRVTIHVENWDFEDDNRELDCGSFEIDTVDFSGPPNKIDIKALSTPISTNLRRGVKTRAWEKASLQYIASVIAADANLKLMYEVDDDIKFDRIEQEEETDIKFLNDLCGRFGVSLKTTDGILVLFEEKVYEEKEAVETFDADEIGGRLLRYSFSQNTSDTVCKVEASYKDPKSGYLVQAEFIPPEPPATGQIARLNERPADLGDEETRMAPKPKPKAPPGVLQSMLLPDGTLKPEYKYLFPDFYKNETEAKGTFDTGFTPFNDTTEDFNSIQAHSTDSMLRIAKAFARAKNKNEWTCTLQLRGNPNIIGGVNIQLTGFGVYDGKYFVDEAAHVISDGYRTTVKAHKCLVGY